MSALKRGKTEDYEQSRTARQKKTDTELAAGVELRVYLLDTFIVGELNNSQVAVIADLHQRNGGTGLESFAVPSSSHSSRSVVKRYIEVFSQPLKNL